MIDSLRVSGFKVLDDVKLPNLGRLNLFLGENNTGKSCLLEAVSLYAGRMPIADLLQVAAERSNERLQPWEIDGLTEEGTSVTHPIFELFHRKSNSPAKAIFIGKIRDSAPLLIECIPHKRVLNEDGLSGYVPVPSEDISVDGAEMALVIRRGDKKVGLLTRGRLRISGSANSEKIPNEDAQSVAFVPSGGFSEEKAAAAWDALVQGPGQELVLTWLRMLDPSIEDLVFIAGRRQSRLALLKIKGQRRIPLRSMGDGLTRLFHIAVAMASSSKGVLLIDEFENGLHWSVQKTLWTAIAKAASDYDLQVFATTHSRDCIEAFSEAAEHTGPEVARMYRLQRIENNVSAMELPLQNVAAAIREHEEVR